MEENYYKENKMGFIYKITNDINNKCYIGQTHHSIEYRWNLHKKNYLYVKTPLYTAFKKYGLEHFNIVMVEECPAERLNEREIYWIAYYDTYNHGYNATLGGEGHFKHDYNQILNLWQEGYHINQIAKQINAHPHVIGNILRDLGINKNEIYHRGAGNNRKMVGQFSLNGTLLKIYPSTSEASRQTDAPQPNISKCCRGGMKTCHGYKWEYLESDEYQQEKYEILKEYQK